MKISASIRAVYEAQLDSRVSLKNRVDALLRSRLKEGWHYESRVKTIESFTLKLESGRFDEPSALEDFFAATIVVRNGLEVSEAEKKIKPLFTFKERRPKQNERTHKAPDQFLFDDLRLYLRWKDERSMPATGLDGVLFELQVKTFLQHAWAIATHDLIYKADEANWSKMRIAFQIKAMLEHAEISIQEASLLSQSAALAKSDSIRTSENAFIKLVTDLWRREDLPADIRRLAENISGLAKLAGLNVDSLRQLLEEEKTAGRGPLTRNLSPYGIVLQTLFARRADTFCDALKEPQRIRALISREVELPQGVNTATWKNAVFVE